MEKTVTILQITDTHIYGDSKQDKLTAQLLDNLLQQTKPNVLVLTGDNIESKNCSNFLEAMTILLKPAIDRKISWVYVPGNHDAEMPEQWQRLDLLKVFSLPNCLTRDWTTFDGVIKVGPVRLYLIDSNDYIGNNYKEYDFIHPDQVENFLRLPKDPNCELGLVFFHIPLCEYENAKILVGVQDELVCSSKHNSGFFDAMLKRGDIHMASVGHDHLNDFVSEFKGVWLAYGRNSGFAPACYYKPRNYSMEKFTAREYSKYPARGARVIKYNSETHELSTWIETANGPESGTLIKRQIEVISEK